MKHRLPVKKGRPPAWSTYPQITGDGLVGGIHTCAPGDAPGTISFQWLRNGVEISSATVSTYTSQAADNATSLACRVTAVDNEYIRSSVSGTISIKNPLQDTNWPADIAAADWTWVEVSTADFDGKRDMTISTGVPAWDTTAHQLLWSDGTVQGGSQSPTLKEYLPTERGTAVRKNNIFAAGTKLYCNLWWYRISDATYRAACIDGERTLTVKGYIAPSEPTPIEPAPEPVASYGNLSLAAVNSAISQPLTTYMTNQSATTNAHAWGQSFLALALDAHKGNTRSDSRLEAQVAHILNGNEPICSAAIMTQMANRAASAFAVIRNTPRIWDSYTTARKNKITAIMKGILLAAAYIASDNNPFAGKRSLTGLSHNVKSSGGNISGGPPAAIMCCIAFFGVTIANNLIENYSHSAWLSELSSYNLSYIHRSFNYRALGITTVNTTGGLSSNAPTPTQIKDSLTNWRYYTKRISDLKGIMFAESALPKTLEKTIQSGLNNGAGAAIDRNFGKMAQDKSLLPNIGMIGSMFFEYDSADAEGERSSGSYVTWTLRNWTDAFTALAIAGLWDRSDPDLKAILTRFNRAMEDHNFKTSGSRYYLSFSHGKGSLTGSTNNSPFGDSRDWSQGGVTGKQIDMWGLRYTRELWALFWTWSNS